MKWRILVVDDEEDVRLILKSALEPEYEVVEAVNGLDALEKLERVEPDFVMLDVMMPLMNGLDTCEAIRRHPKFHELPVMFLTALAAKDDIKKGYTRGANLYLTKPFEPSRLLRNVEMHFASQGSPRRKHITVAQIAEFEAADAEPVVPGSPDVVPAPPSARGSFESRQTGRITKTYVRRETPDPSSQEAVPHPTPEPAPAAEAPEEAPAPGSQLPRLMIVDDDEDIIALMEQALKGTVEICWANDGIQAIERLVRWQPDIMIIDIMLPKMSGFQLCQSLRANPAFRTLPIMVCSAKCRDKDKEFAKRSGANDFLEKPFTPEDLIAGVRGLVRDPSFRVRLPKSLPINKIRDDLKIEKSDVFDAEHDGLRKRIAALAEAANRGADDELGQQRVTQKKRKLFGFGRKD